MSTIVVPAGTSYVAAALMSTVFLLTGQVVAVTNLRTRAGILQYPHLYADKAEMVASPDAVKFNCAQRAHQNTLENIPMVYMMTVVFAAKHPILAAAALSIWVLSRAAYTIGYLTGSPDNRNNIANRILFPPGLLTLIFGSMYSTYQLLVAGI